MWKPDAAKLCLQDVRWQSYAFSGRVKGAKGGPTNTAPCGKRGGAARKRVSARQSYTVSRGKVML